MSVEEGSIPLCPIPAHAAVDGNVEGVAGAEQHVQNEDGGPGLLVVHEGEAAIVVVCYK